MDSRWWSGQADVSTFQIEELIIDFAEQDLRQMHNESPPVLANLRRDGIDLAGTHRFANSSGAHGELRRCKRPSLASMRRISGQDRTSAIRRAGKLVDFARDVLQR